MSDEHLPSPDGTTAIPQQTQPQVWWESQILQTMFWLLTGRATASQTNAWSRFFFALSGLAMSVASAKWFFDQLSRGVIEVSIPYTVLFWVGIIAWALAREDVDR